MKKILIIILSLIILTGCNEKNQDNQLTENKSVFDEIDAAFMAYDINFTRDAKLNEENYYAKEAWQYVIDDASCIVDVYYYGEDSDIYKESYDSQSIISKDYDNLHITATVNKGFGAIIWQGCSNKINDILSGL